MPKANRTSVGATRRRPTKQPARSEGRVKAEAAQRAVARSASLEADIAPCDLDSTHSRLVVKNELATLPTLHV
jgi:hypothetical protein